MAYQNVFTPRFYIDYLSYWQSIGNVEISIPDGATIEGTPLGLNPSSKCLIQGELNPNDGFVISFNLKDRLEYWNLEPINYIGYLGHKFGITASENSDVATRVDFFYKESGWQFNDIWMGACTQAGIENAEIINANHLSGSEYPGESGLDNYTSITVPGFSLFKVNANMLDQFGWANKFKIVFKEHNGDQVMSNYIPSYNLNSFILGHYYDMPHSPDLDLKMEIEFDGYDHVETVGGSTLTNVRYTGNPKWNDMNAWEIGASSPLHKRNGRRVWNLKFSFINDKDLFASNYSSNNWLSDTTDNSGYDSADLNTEGDKFEYTLADDDSFISRVLNYVGNGQRFIFQPDSNNNNPDQFAICVLDQESLSLTQKAFKAYEFSLKIREVW